MKLGPNTSVTEKGTHRGIHYSVSAHNFRDEKRSSYDFSKMWATYLYLTEAQYVELKDRLDDAPWNGGITLRQKITTDYLDAPDHLAAKWNKPIYKIGDDFSHLWDHERCAGRRRWRIEYSRR